METQLTRLYNTLVTIETKGENTKTMADCLRYLEQLIAKEKTASKVVEQNEAGE